MKMINLFEYQNKVLLNESFNDFEKFLDEIWNRRERNSFYLEKNNNEIENQQFIDFLYKTSEIKSTNYVGVINYNGNKLNLLPKIFYTKNKDYNETDINHIQNHILWWLSYCRKIKFPNYQTSLGDKKSDFFEVLIYLFSKYTRELLSNSIFQQYEEEEKELLNIKGRINFNKYITENISKGNLHKINCTYDSFVFDNEFNRIIKYVANLLFRSTTNEENKKLLREILFILDEVSDIVASADQCSKISFNPMFGEYQTIRDYCYLFLKNCISFNYKNDLKLFAFLIPMEYLFEDFIYGFIEKEINTIKIKAQRFDTYLDENKIFKLKPDLYLENENKRFIADTKYKIINSDELDSQMGISQTDIYQMLTYAVRFQCEDILIFYPNTINQNELKNKTITICDKLANDKVINIKITQLPIICHNIFYNELESNLSINDIFESQKKELKSRLEDIFFD